MADQCPACEREFRCLEDYPLIYIATFNKGDIPAELEFPFLDPTTFVEPSSKFCNEKVPAKVLGLFKKNKEA
ncbi:hypothetical protein HY501_00180, partial [Candidatus Woesearchaeota archaeon]|nr:hypothetical protein [Candidatus Woesearchaeota archaeon]